jgi:IclR family transcriptional regulator, acetate operon repressor
MGILQRCADLVQLLADEGALTPAEIAERVDTPRPTVYRLSDALGQATLTETMPGYRIKLSLRWLRLGDAARAAMSEWQQARPILDALATSTGQTVFLSVLRGQESVCIDWARGQAINVLLLKPGRSLPLHAGAAGRVALAFGKDKVDAYLEQAPFSAFTSHTLTTAAELRRDMRLTHKQGYVISDEDVTEGIGAIGAPLWTSRNHGFAGALSIAGLAEEFTSRRAELVDSLLDTAKTLSATLP